MKRTTRLGLSICAVVGALVGAASAAAVPRLTVGAPAKFALGGSTVSIRFSEATTDAAPAKISIYAPEGYTVNGAAIGQQIGTFRADMQMLATSSQSTTSVRGAVTSEDPGKYAKNTCSTGAHTYVWLLHLTVAGKALSVPVYVDAPVPASDPFAGNSQVRLTLCLASPYSQAGAARSPSGMKLTRLALTLNENIVMNPSARGIYGWRSIVTPYTPHTGAINTAGTVEARAMVFMPTRLGLTAKVVRTRRHVRIHGRPYVTITNWAVLRGQLLEGTQGIYGARVVFLSGPRAPRLHVRATATTNGAGVFVRRIPLASRSAFQARVTLADRDVTSKYCATSAPGIPCVSATAPAFSILTDVVTLKPRRR